MNEKIKCNGRWWLFMKKILSCLITVMVLVLLCALSGCKKADNIDSQSKASKENQTDSPSPAADIVSSATDEVDAVTSPMPADTFSSATASTDTESLSEPEADTISSPTPAREAAGAEAESKQEAADVKAYEKGAASDTGNETLHKNEDDTMATDGMMPEKLSAPAIVVKKSQRILELWDGDSLFASYPIGLGWEPQGDKKKEGDGRTPEGSYYICTRNDRSRFYLSLGLSYPNSEDAQEALDNGIIDRRTYEQIVNAIENKSCPPWNTALGGEIMIHGMGSSSDWTAGCIAVDNDVMDILWRYCPLKTPVTIEP